MTDRRARVVAVILTAVATLAVTGFGAWRVMRGADSSVDVDRAVFPIVGADLSAHNGHPDFDSLATVLDFVYLKASEGTRFRDREFNRNYSEAQRTGIPVGAYHFFRFDRDGRSQAANFIGVLAENPCELPPAIDIEEYGNPAQVPTALIIERLQTMVALMRAEGYEPIVYTNKKGHARFCRNVFEPDEMPGLWICSFTNPPLARTDWLFWQHSHSGRLPGVSGNVDFNTFNGTRADWSDFLLRTANR